LARRSFASVLLQTIHNRNLTLGKSLNGVATADSTGPRWVLLRLRPSCFSLFSPLSSVLFYPMSNPASSPVDLLVAEVIRLFPAFMQDPIDRDQCLGNAAVCAIGPDGRIVGHIFGDNKARGHGCFGIVNRKVIQVWRTGYATGRFEELVFAGKLDEGQFGVNRPDFIGWEGGVPLLLADGTLLAAAFSGFRGIKDVEIITTAAAAVPGLRVKRD
jgi:glc operon protein GlcG